MPIANEYSQYSQLCSDALAKIIIYSMALDGPIRDSENGTSSPNQPSFLAGSRALDSLDKMITSTESYFHPSNTGHWTFSVGYSVLFS